MNLSNLKQHEILNELYIQACGDLLPAYGLEINIREQGAGTGTRGESSSYISILGATGDGINVSSVLNIDRDLVLRTHPTGSTDLSQEDLEDWCRELNNQLVGRLKNKLLGFGHVLIMGLPILITGTNVRPVAAPDSEVHEYCVEAGEGKMTLTLVTLVSPHIVFHGVEALENEEALLFEGDIALF